MNKIILTMIILTNIIYGQTIKISTGEWQPWISETLKKDGVAMDIVKSIFKTQNLDVKLSFYPWKRAYKDAKIGKFDATAIWFKNKDREKDFLFSNPIFATQDVIIYKKGKKINYNTLNDLKKYKIAITRGYSYGEKFDTMVKLKQVKIKWVNSDLLALKQIEKRNNFDLFICAKSVAKSLIADNFKDPSVFVFHPKALIKNQLYFLVSKKIKNGQQIIDAFNKGLKEFKDKKLIESMINKSYNGEYK